METSGAFVAAAGVATADWLCGDVLVAGFSWAKADERQQKHAATVSIATPRPRSKAEIEGIDGEIVLCIEGVTGYWNDTRVSERQVGGHHFSLPFRAANLASHPPRL